MEREQLVGAGLGVGWRGCGCAGGVGQRPVCGGLFTMAGGTAANYIAKWNGSSWTALGSGLSFAVRRSAVLGTNLYAGGGFTTAGGSAATNIAKWNGSSWTALGSG